MAGVTLLAVIGTARLVSGRAAAIPEIASGIKGYCLDVRGNADAVVENWPCNETAAQNWTLNPGAVKHSGDCLSVQNNGTSIGSRVVVSACDSAPGQVWLSDKGGLENPNSGLCLADPESRSGVQLALAACRGSLPAGEIWTAKMSDSNANLTPSCDGTTGGKRVACFAQQQWTTWQSGSPGHEALLTTYTAGAPYEEWCADFVSYIYKQAGYPFTGGETDGWDENNANNIQNMGFTMHYAADYVPQPGDVAYFDYEGGHVEVVVSGGKIPTFIYGNSGTIDPATGNGQMAANTTASDGSRGQVIYYLSPSF